MFGIDELPVGTIERLVMPNHPVKTAVLLIEISPRVSPVHHIEE
jgi:hypothetical protein